MPNISQRPPLELPVVTNKQLADADFWNLEYSKPIIEYFDKYTVDGSIVYPDITIGDDTISNINNFQFDVNYFKFNNDIISFNIEKTYPNINIKDTDDYLVVNNDKKNNFTLSTKNIGKFSELNPLLGTDIITALNNLYNKSTGDVTSVNGKTGVVVLDKTDIGLGNVDNTSDIDKPISKETQDALDKKQGFYSNVYSTTSPKSYIVISPSQWKSQNQILWLEIVQFSIGTAVYSRSLTTSIFTPHLVQNMVYEKIIYVTNGLNFILQISFDGNNYSLLIYTITSSGVQGGVTINEAYIYTTRII